MSTIANAKVEHNYNRYNGYFFGCLQTIPNYLPIALKRYHRSVVSGTIIALRAVPPVSL